MLSKDEAVLLNSYAKILIYNDVWDEVVTYPGPDSTIYIHLTYSARNVQPMSLRKENNWFMLLDGEMQLVAEGETLEEALQPWRHIVHKEMVLA